MKTITKITTEIEIISEVLCNQCGESCHPQEAGKNKFGQPYFCGLIDTKVIGWDYSPALNDATEYNFSLCEVCLKKLFDGFKLPVSERETVWGD